MALHPTCQRFLDEDPAVAAWGDVASMSPEKARRLAAAETAPGVPMHSVRDIQIPAPGRSIRARIYHPTADPSGVLVWFHGGGFVHGSIEAADRDCRALAAAATALVVSVEYRLAPEHPFPAGLTDCYDAVRWVAESRDRLDVEGAKLGIGGESAGGALAASVALMARDRGGPPIDHQLLLCAMTCREATDLPSREQLGTGYFLTEAAIQWCWSHYLAGPEDARDPLASPLLAESLDGLPPALVITTEYDPLRDEAERYAARLRETRVPVEVRRVPGLLHGLLSWTEVTSEAAQELRHIGNVMQASLGAASTVAPRA